MKDIVVIHTTRDEGGRVLYEQLHSGVQVQYYRRRPGQSRVAITIEEIQAAMAPTVEVPDHSRPPPASVHERPAFGPMSRRPL